MQAGGRTGAGALHRPHRLIVWLSLPVALLFSGAAVLGLLLAIHAVFGGGAPLNYTLAEVVAARHWCVHTAWPCATCFASAMLPLHYTIMLVLPDDSL